jgi:hypothetical protein
MRRRPPLRRNRSPESCPGPFFHATSYEAVNAIAAEGLVPRRGGGTFSHGGYGEHSQGKVFLAKGKDAALNWFGKVGDMLEYNASDYDETPDARVPVLLRIEEDALLDAQDVFVDPVGDRDVPCSFFVTKPIPAEDISFWHPTRRRWEPVEDWGPDADLGVERQTLYGPDGDEVDEEEAADLADEGESVTIGFDLFGPYDRGGFKPPYVGNDAAWE